MNLFTKKALLLTLESIESIAINVKGLTSDQMVEEVYGQMNDFFDMAGGLNSLQTKLVDDQFATLIKKVF